MCKLSLSPPLRQKGDGVGSSSRSSMSESAPLPIRRAKPVRQSAVEPRRYCVHEREKSVRCSCIRIISVWVRGEQDRRQAKCCRTGPSTKKNILDIISAILMLDPDRREGSKNSRLAKMTRVAEKIFLSCYAVAGAALIRCGVNSIRDLVGDVDTASIRRHGTQ